MSRSAGVLRKATQLWSDFTGRVVAGQPTSVTHPQVGLSVLAC